MDLTTNYIIVIILALNLVHHGKSSVKIWAYDSDIHNPSNWVGGKAQTYCEGLDLSENYDSWMALEDLNVKTITLPLSGRLLLTGAPIEFNEQSRDVMNCAKIKELVLLNYWLNPSAWFIKDDDRNVAIPHYERVPCKYDDVVFPKGFQSGICVLLHEVEIKSFKFGDDYLTNEDIKNDINLQHLVFPYYVSKMLRISGTECTDPTGCVCAESTSFDVDLCMDVNETIYFNCLDPVLPIGFCTKICGASITLIPKSDFQIANVRESLKHYTSDTYVSKVKNGSEEIIQIIFAEKEFSGSSLDDANDYFSRLSADDTVEAKSVQLHSSGPYFVEGDTMRIAFSVVFGTLCGVVFIFASLFLIYSPRFAALNLGNRLYLSSTTLSSFRGNLFAKYHNTENEELILERQSPAGSMVNLEKSFDNPMFGMSAPPLATTSYGTISTSNDTVTKSEISLENPMYEIHNSNESVQGVTEEDLGDLIQKEE